MRLGIHPAGILAATAALAALAAASVGGAYPLDRADETGITRLEAYRRAAEQLVARGRLAPGATFGSERIRLRLMEHPDFEVPPPDPELSAEIRGLLGADAPHYGLALLDLTDPADPVYAAVNDDKTQNPGSVGKILVALAWFQALADVYPDDVDARKRLLREATIEANGFIHTDHHTVPFWQPGDPRVEKRPIALGDRANVWTYLDWMCSASSNAAAAMLMSHLVLLKHFGPEYPVSEERAAAFFEDTSKSELQKIFLDAITGPVSRNGLDLGKLRQGSFFTREGKRRVPGTSSHATPRELLRYVVKMEQGELVDPWSSLEIKRLLYLTDRRIRYASSPALREAAVIFKSGSLYSCRPEEGFVCRKYMGNRLNYMNSVTSVETFGPQDLHYVSVVLSNVLRKNSAVAHQTLGTRIHRLIQARHPGEAGGDWAGEWSEEELRKAAEGSDG